MPLYESTVTVNRDHGDLLVELTATLTGWGPRQCKHLDCPGCATIDDHQIVSVERTESTLDYSKTFPIPNLWFLPPDERQALEDAIAKANWRAVEEE